MMKRPTRINPRLFEVEQEGLADFEGFGSVEECKSEQFLVAFKGDA